MLKFLLLFIVVFQAQADSEFGENYINVTKEARLEEEAKRKKEAEVKKLPDSFFTTMIPDALKDKIAEVIKSNPFSLMERSDVEKFVLMKMSGTAFGDLLERNERVRNIFVEILVDKKAFPSLLGILAQTDKMKKFSFVFLFVFILSFIFNLRNSNKGLMKRIMFKFSIMISATTINFFAFYFIFKKELDPLVTTISRAW